MFNRTLVLPDNLFTFQDLNVQNFLKERNSFLGDYAPNKILASDLIRANCQKFNVNPKWILNRLQCEQGLVSRLKRPSDKVLSRALGFGATDTGDLTQYYGFENQIINACKWSRQHFDNAKLKPLKINEDRDGTFQWITPANKFTEIMYVYTPWIDNNFHIAKNKQKLEPPYGAYLTWKVWKGYWSADIV